VVIMKSMISKSLLLGTVSAVAFLSVHSSVFSATPRFEDDGQALVVHRNPPRSIQLADFDEMPAPALPGGGDLAQVAHAPQVAVAKPADFADWLEINQNDAVGAPVVAAARSKDILQVVSSTVVKPVGRVLWSTLKGAYEAVPPVARAVCWTGSKTWEAAGNTLSSVNDARLFALDARRKLNAGTATLQEIGQDAGKRTGAAVDNTFKWLGSSIIEGLKGTVPSLWSGAKWTAVETWENTKAFVRDIREAYLDDVASAAWSSVKSVGAKSSAYVQDVASAAASKVKAAASSTASYLSSKLSSAWNWFTQSSSSLNGAGLVLSSI
jgi:hypothetical protein